MVVSGNKEQGLKDGCEEEAELLHCCEKGEALYAQIEQEVELLPGGEEGEVLEDGGEEDAELQSSQTLPQTNPSSPTKWQETNKVPRSEVKTIRGQRANSHFHLFLTCLLDQVC